MIAVAIAALTLAAAAPSAQAQDGAEPAAQPAGSASSSALMSQPGFVTRAINFVDSNVDQRGGRDGFYPEVANMITGAGWISAGPGYRQHFWNSRGLVDGSAAISWHAYKMAQARFELSHLAADHLTVGAQVRWQDLTQVNYFGLGPDSLGSQQSEFRLKSTNVVGYAAVQTTRWLTIGGNAGWLHRPTLAAPAGPFDRGFPDTQQVFSADPGVGQPVTFAHGEVSITADTRDRPGHPTSGGLYRAVAAQYSDRDLGQFSFRRYEAEGLQVVPVVGSRWTLAAHGWLVASDSSADNSVPFYMTPSLGGHDTLRGYRDYRYHDRNLLVANLESRWALTRDIDAAAFFDAGNVAPRIGDLNLDKTSYGVGVRVHSRTSTLGRLDVGHSREGWRVLLRLNDPFRFKRVSQQTAMIPFVP
jgi:hypothetical protein